MSLLLSEAAVRELTKRQHRDAQERQLKALGIPFGRRADGSLAVLRSVVEHALGADVVHVTMTRPEPQLMP